MAASDPALGSMLLATPTALDDARMRDVEALVREAGWNQVAADWRIFLELGHVHAAHDGPGASSRPPRRCRMAGFGWISMVLVTGEYRRQGLATRLMQRCIDDLRSPGCVPVLDATPAGREVYRALGFEDTWSFHRLASGGAGTRRGCAQPGRPFPDCGRHRTHVAAPIDDRCRSGPRSAPMTRPPSARTAARCSRTCAGGCRRRRWSRCAAVASRASCSGATAAPPRSSGR